MPGVNPDKRHLQQMFDAMRKNITFLNHQNVPSDYLLIL